MTKRETISLNIVEENKRWLEQRTEEIDCETAEYIHEIIQKHIDIVSDESDHPYDCSKRLRTLVDEVYDETDILLREFWGETTDESDGQHQPGHLHLLVLWRLLAGEYADAEREYAMQLAQEYIGEDLDIVPDASPVGPKWRDTTDGESQSAQNGSRGFVNWPDSVTDDKETDTDTDRGLRAVDFMTDATGGDADE